jgi:hypothetical protein
MRTRVWFCVTVASFILWLAPPVLAEKWDQIFEICVDELKGAFPQPLPIPIGCQVIDCCPGCPAPLFLDWRVSLTGNLAESVRLELNVPKSENFSIKKGKGILEEGNRVKIGKGEVVLSGLAPLIQGQVPVVSPRLDLTRAIRNLREEAGTVNAMTLQKTSGKVELLIEQVLGQVVVNEYKVQYILKFCHTSFAPPPPMPTPMPASDQIVLTNNVGGNEAVIRLDGRRSSGCGNDEIYRGTGVIDVDNVLSDGTCNSEVEVFAKDRAMQLIAPVAAPFTEWTDNVGDQLRVDLTAGILQVPVKIYIMQGPFDGLGGTLARAQNDIEQAGIVYNNMKCGIGFGPVMFIDKTANPGALLDSGCETIGGVDDPASLMGGIGYDGSVLNVYYLGDPGGLRGQTCVPSPNYHANIVLISSSADQETLSHEFGRAFSLEETNGNASISLQNIMYSGGTGRSEITLGQCFRCNANKYSFLNFGGIRRDDTVLPGAENKWNCPDKTTNPVCPALSLRAP